MLVDRWTNQLSLTSKEASVTRCWDIACHGKMPSNEKRSKMLGKAHTSPHNKSLYIPPYQWKPRIQVTCQKDHPWTSFMPSGTSSERSQGVWCCILANPVSKMLFVETNIHFLIFLLSSFLARSILKGNSYLVRRTLWCGIVAVTMLLHVKQLCPASTVIHVE